MSIGKKFDDLSFHKTNLIIFLVGFIIAIIGFLISPTEVQMANGNVIQNSDFKNLLMSIGCSIIASSLVSFLAQKYMVKKDEFVEMISKWGIAAIFKTREEANTLEIEKCIGEMSKNLDIIGFGLDGFRNSKKKIIEEKLKKNKDIKIRIITLNPKSEFVKKREKDEGKNEGSISKSILDLKDWIEKIHLLNKDNICIKYYDTLPLDSFLKVDYTIFVGPYEYGKISSQSITYMFEKGGQGFDYYSNYFDDLWNNDQLCSTTFSQSVEKAHECMHPTKIKFCENLLTDGLNNYYSSYNKINNVIVSKEIKKAKHIKFVEIYSDKQIKQYFNVLEDVLSNKDSTLEVFLIDTERQNTGCYNYLNNKFKMGNNLNGRVESASGVYIDTSGLISELRRLKKKVGSGKGTITVYYSDYVPQYSTTIIDNIAYVVLYQTSPGRSSDIPAFKIIKDTDSKFYDFIINDIENLKKLSRREVIE
ncbi:hypothetical protein ACQR2L_01535 [Clostridium butyricum]|uniref:hypothetical protein n=1 Tax=Clostridium butyricum TaxID=1492 RepID=UPI00374E95D3